MQFDEYIKHDALGLAALIREKQVSAQEVLEAAMARLEAVNPQINAVIHKMYDEAKAMLAQFDPQAPFAGVPFLLKDLGIHIKGQPLLTGCRGYKGFISSEDSEIVARYRKAGLLFVGRTNVPEFGLTPFTEPQLFGPTKNPWNLAHSPGGSSGGSAAAVAAGIVPMATASDGGGSIRIPAACCGLFGLKTSRGRTPMGEKWGEMWSGAVVEHVVSRSVRDSAAILDAIQGETLGAPYLIQDPVKPYLQEITQTPEKLTIGYSVAHPFGLPVHDDCQKAVLHTVKLLQDLGHQVEVCSLPYQPEDFKFTFLTMILGETAADLKELGDFLGRRPKRSDVELNTWLLSELGKAYTAQEFAYAKRRWNDISRRCGVFHQKYDLLLTPTLALPPIRIGQLQNTASENTMLNLIGTLGITKWLKGGKVIDQLAEKTFGYIPFTPAANLTGQPSASLPLYWNQDQLPIGVQFTAALNREDIIFRLSAQLEQAQPWFDKRPVL